MSNFNAGLLYRKIAAKYQNMYLVFIAVIIGAAAAGGNIAFRTAISLIQRFCFGTDEEVVLPALNSAPFYKILFIPAIGGLLVGAIYHFYKTPEGKGVPMVIKALINKSKIPPLNAVVTTFTAAITLGTGGSAGREGPIAQIGAALGSTVGVLFRFPKNRMRFAIASGAGGGLAATFNTPMAGAMFTAEVLLRKLEFKVFAPVVISCVTATVVSRAYFGNHVTFAVPEYALTSWFELLLYAGLGIFVGIIGACFIRFYFHVTDLFKRMPVPGWLKPAIGGLLLGFIGIFVRNVMGVGYGTIVQILNGTLVGYFLLLLVGLKMIATSLTLGSGGSGGLFVPSLFVGAALGGFFGWGLHTISPEYFSESGSYALVAMGAMLAATMRAPITGILMIFEITQSYQVVLPLMLTVIIANVCASWLEKDSFMTKPLADEGVNLNYGNEVSILEQVYVRDMMLKDAITFNLDTPMLKMIADIRRHPHEFFPVLDDRGILKAVITLKDLRGALFDPSTDNEALTAKDFCTTQKILMVTAESSLAEALALFGMKDIGDLPVVEETDDGPLFVGLLRRTDILRAYNNNVLQANNN